LCLGVEGQHLDKEKELDVDDLINNIIESDDKPQPKKAEAFSVPEPKPSVQEVSPPVDEIDDEWDLDPKWTKVPARKRNPMCGTCRKKLKGGEWHWRYDSGPAIGEPKSRHEIYWWCSRCIPRENKDSDE